MPGYAFGPVSSTRVSNRALDSGIGYGDVYNPGSQVSDDGHSSNIVSEPQAAAGRDLLPGLCTSRCLEPFHLAGCHHTAHHLAWVHAACDWMVAIAQQAWIQLVTCMSILKWPFKGGRRASRCHIPQQSRKHQRKGPLKKYFKTVCTWLSDQRR